MHPNRALVFMGAFNSAEVQQCRKLMFFGSVEQKICFWALLYFGTVERPSNGITRVPKYNSAENKFFVQQCQKSSIFGTVEHFFIFGTVVLPRFLYFGQKRICYGNSSLIGLVFCLNCWRHVAVLLKNELSNLIGYILCINLINFL